jgi:hypothetical protein
MPTTSTAQQGLDQTVKGLIIGVLTWLAMKYEVPAEVTVPAMALVALGLAWLSTKVGADKGTASFVGPKGTTNP